MEVRMWTGFLFIILIGQSCTAVSTLSVVIMGPNSFITDGTRQLTLRCIATHAPSGSTFAWSPPEIQCAEAAPDQGNCTFIPNLEPDGTAIICTVIAPDGNTSQASYTLNLQYPPESAPEITSSKPDQILTDGDHVTCRVRGGKPPVSTVSFSCINPDLEGEPSDTGESSTVTVDTSRATEGGMTCTCRATWDPEPDLYTLSNQETFVVDIWKAVIVGPKVFITDGSRKLTLRCISPAPQGVVYVWSPSSIPCEETNPGQENCTFTPGLAQDNMTVFCTLVFPGDRQTVANFTLNLWYPPPSSPEITSSGSSQTLADGDHVTCTVKGGQPPVSSVNFSCINPDLEGQISATGESSIVTVHPVQIMECTCRATWDPEPGLYAPITMATFHYETGPAVTSTSTSTGAVVGGVVGGILALVVISTVVVVVWRLRSPRYQTPLPKRDRDSEHNYTGLRHQNDVISLQSADGIPNPGQTNDVTDTAYQNVSTSSTPNTYDPVRMSGRSNTDVYTELHLPGTNTGADGYELPVTSSKP